MKLEGWNAAFQFASAILLGLTFAVGTGAVITGLFLTRRQAAEIADLKNKTARANERTQRLEFEASQLRSDNLKLEAEVAPRRLSNEQAKELASLTAFAGSTVAIKSYSSDTEGAILATEILEALEKSKINIEDNRLTMLPSGSVSFGVLIEGPDKSLVDKLKAVLGGLTRTSTLAVNRGGVSTSVSFGSTTFGTPAAATIIVGPKPIN